MNFILSTLSVNTPTASLDCKNIGYFIDHLTTEDFALASSSILTSRFLFSMFFFLAVCIAFLIMITYQSVVPSLIMFTVCIFFLIFLLFSTTNMAFISFSLIAILITGVLVLFIFCALFFSISTPTDLTYDQKGFSFQILSGIVIRYFFKLSAILQFLVLKVFYWINFQKNKSLNISFFIRFVLLIILLFLGGIFISLTFFDLFSNEVFTEKANLDIANIIPEVNYNMLVLANAKFETTLLFFDNDLDIIHEIYADLFLLAFVSFLLFFILVLALALTKEASYKAMSVLLLSFNKINTNFIQKTK